MECQSVERRTVLLQSAFKSISWNLSPIPRDFVSCLLKGRTANLKHFKGFAGYSQRPILKLIRNWNFVSNLKSYI